MYVWTLDLHKASGPDHISPYILRHFAEEIRLILYVIFNQSLSTSSLPQGWLTTNIDQLLRKVVIVVLLIIGQ